MSPVSRCSYRVAGRAPISRCRLARGAVALDPRPAGGYVPSPDWRRQVAKKGGWIDTAEADSPFAALRALARPEPDRESSPAEAASPQPSSGPTASSPAGSAPAPRRAVVRIEKKGRGGRTVTRIERLGLDADALAALATRLRRALGCGGAVEGEDIIVQGDVRDRVVAWLEADGVTRISR